MNQNHWEKCYEAVMKDPAASWWLKGSLNGAIQYRDPIDVLNDLDVMQKILLEWATNVIEEHENVLQSLSFEAQPADRLHLPGLSDGL